jgi:glycosyltransferase involved in cell wall biosynthesis
MTNALAQLTDPAARTKLGQAALARFLDRFTVEQMVQQYERVYERLAPRGVLQAA